MEQIIDENGNIVDHLEQQITKSGIAKDGIDYHTLAIIGCQSSGKSTLLNLLFGTKFLTMNDQIGRQQTTKGIHAAKATNSELLVFDVEGSDSRERGDADALFERKSSLFALALSEVLIINMWESDIGRYNAANLPMLKTVFEMNVQLFLAENQVKSKIIFVIRDCTAPNFEAITFQIERDMQNIWDEIEIPEKLSGKHITDFFEFEFFPIHHMLIEKSKFDDDISTLRKWFIDKTYKDYVFNDKSDKVVPGEGLSQYIINLWTVINENKELNIPSQKTMLARFKCDENAKLALEQLTNELTPTVFNILDVSEKPLDHFKEICEGNVKNALTFYHDNSWRYNETIVKERESELKNEIKLLIEPYFTKQISFYAEDAKENFTNFINSFEDTFPVGGTWTVDVQGKIDILCSNLYQKVEENKISPFNLVYPVHELQKQFTDMTTEKEKELVEKTHELIITEDLREFEDQVNLILKDNKSTMWDDLRKCLQQNSTKAIQEITDILKTNAPYSKPNSNIQTIFEDHILSLIKESANYVLLKMKRTFDKTFKYEPNGRPRVWKRSDNINEIYENSRRNALQVLRLFTYCRLGDPNNQIQNDRLNQILINPDQSSEIEQKFERIIIHAYEEARSIIKAQHNKQEIPSWAWFLLFVCAGNYIIRLLSNPFIFTFVMLFGGTYFIIKQLGLSETIQNALLTKFTQLLREITNTGTINATTNNSEQETNEIDEEIREISNEEAMKIDKKAETTIPNNQIRNKLPPVPAKTPKQKEKENLKIILENHKKKTFQSEEVFKNK